MGAKSQHAPACSRPKRCLRRGPRAPRAAPSGGWHRLPFGSLIGPLPAALPDGCGDGPGRPGSPESRRWAAVTPGARDHGFVAACRACRSARSNARPTPQFGPHTGPDGARRGLEAAWWPRIRPCGHHRGFAELPDPGRPRWAALRRSRAHRPATVETAAGIRGHSRRPRGPPRRDVRMFARGRPRVRPGRTSPAPIKVCAPEQPVNFHQPPRAAAQLTDRAWPPRRTRATDDGWPLPRDPSGLRC